MEHFMKMKKKVSSTETTRQVLNKAIDLLHKLSNQKIKSEEVKSELSQVFSQYFLSQNGAENGIEERNKLKLEILLKETCDIVDRLDSGRIPLYESIMLMNKVAAGFGQPKQESELSANKAEEVVTEMNVEKESPTTVRLRPTKNTSEESSVDFPEEGFDYSGAEREKKIHELTRSEEEKPAGCCGSGSSHKEKCCSGKNSQEKHSSSKRSHVNELMADVLRYKEMLDQSVGNLNEALGEIGFELKPIDPK